MEDIGKEGMIECVFLCEFHSVRGPMMVCQYPEHYISKEVFEAVSVYLIPKQQLKQYSMSVNMLNYKITGYPNTISNPKYERNAFMFNFCIVCKGNCRTVQYEPIVQKISEHFENLEHESGFLTSEDGRKQLPMILEQIQQGLNSRGLCKIEIVVKDCQQGPRRISFSLRGERKSLENAEKSNEKNGTEEMVESSDEIKFKESVDPPYISALYLHTVPLRTDPITVQDYSVPVFTGGRYKLPAEKCDMTAQEVVAYIDGNNHVAKIAVKSDVNINLVQTCIENLCYYGVVKLLPQFLYSNTYTTLPGLHKLYVDKNLQQQCLKFVSRNENDLPSLANIFRCYASMVYGVTISDICQRLNPKSWNIDEIKLVYFGTMNNFIRRIYIYPVLVNDRIDHSSNTENNSSLYSMCNGLHPIDEICSKYGMSPKVVHERLEKDVNIVFLRR